MEARGMDINYSCSIEFVFAVELIGYFVLIFWILFLTTFYGGEYMSRQIVNMFHICPLYEKST